MSPADRSRPAKRAFVGRDEVAAVFRGALARHAGQLADDAIGAGSGATENLLGFHGMHGIGKTALFDQLQRWVDHQQAGDRWSAFPPKANAVRLDFDGPGSVDRFLLALRVQLRSLGVRCDAFDLALWARWTVARPGEARPEVASISGGALTRWIRAGITLALPGVPGVSTLVDQGFETAPRILRGWREAGVHAQFLPLEQVLIDVRRPGDQAAVEVLGALDWDVARLDAARRPRLVVFADRCDGPLAERLVLRMAAVAPHVFWVVASERPLTGIPDGIQHRLEDLPVEARERWAQRMLDDPAVPESVRAHVVERGGLPLYLELAHDHVARRLQAGATVTPADLDGGLEELIRRIAADLPEAEREALNAAALVVDFDPQLAARAVRGREGAALRVAVGPLATQMAGTPERFRLHAQVREATRARSERSPSGWTAGDWKDAAERMLAELDRRQSGEQDVDMRLLHALQAFDIAVDQRVEHEWIVAALFKHPARQDVAEALRDRVASERETPWSRSVTTLLSCWEQPEELLPKLDAAIAGDDLTPAHRRRAQRNRAYRLRSGGRHDEAAAQFAALLREAAEMSATERQIVVFEHGRSLIDLGDFAGARRQMEDLLAVGDAGKADRLAGELALHHGHLAKSADACARRVHAVARNHDAFNVVENSVAEVRRRAFVDPGSIEAIDAVIARAQELRLDQYLQSALTARAIALAGDPERRGDEALARRRQAGAADETVGFVLAKVFDAAVRRDREAMESVAAIADAMPESERNARWWRPISWWRCWLLDEPMPDYSALAWDGGEAQVRERWIDVARLHVHART